MPIADRDHSDRRGHPPTREIGGGLTALAAAVAATGATPAIAAATHPTTPTESPGLQDRDRRLRVRRRAHAVPAPAARAHERHGAERLRRFPFSQLSNERHLTGAAHQPNVQINNDTLYTYSHLDLSRGPLVLQIPKMAGHRYFVMQLLDPYTNDFAYVGTRTTGGRGGNWLITAPGFHGRVPAGMRRTKSKYSLVWLSGRTLVYCPADLPAVHRVQNGYRLLPLAKDKRYGLRWTPPRPKRIVETARLATLPEGLAFFDQLGTALAQSPPPKHDATPSRRRP